MAESNFNEIHDNTVSNIEPMPEAMDSPTENPVIADIPETANQRTTLIISHEDIRMFTQRINNGVNTESFAGASREAIMPRSDYPVTLPRPTGPCQISMQNTDIHIEGYFY